MDRVTFLARLRERPEDGSRGETSPPETLAPETAAPERAAPETAAPLDHGTCGLSGDGLVELFAARLRDSGGEVAFAGSRLEAWAALEGLAGERGWRAVACAPDARQGAPDGLHFTDEARAADFGLSDADWAVAETGSVVVTASAKVRRGYSLVPAAMGFFVSRDRLRATMGDVLRELPAQASSLPSCVSFISGPSGTSDLAAVHVVGVHGPGEVHVWVIEDGVPAG
jgi:hypothetical protein